MVRHKALKNNIKKLVLLCVLFIVFASFAVISFFKMFDVTQGVDIQYNEFGNIKYKVYLKQNEFYDNNYLNENMMYVANLIDKIHIDFDYVFSSSEKIDADFTYNVIATLTIRDKDKQYNYFKKDYVLLNDSTVSMNDSDYNFDKKIDIDYDYYNELATKFKSTYGVDSISELTVALNVNKESDYLTSDKQTMMLQIPLSEKSVNINMTPIELRNQSHEFISGTRSFGNIAFVFVFAITLVGAVITLIKIILFVCRDLFKKTKYQKQVKRILNTYDRFIAELVTKPDFSDCNMMHLDKFKELLDIRDSLKVPIIYYETKSKRKSYFYIKHDKEAYVYVIKEDGKNEK